MAAYELAVASVGDGDNRSRSRVRSLQAVLWQHAQVPMLVYTPRQLPSSVSNAVFAILSLIQPVQYRGDYRPYFTIYDPDYE